MSSKFHFLNLIIAVLFLASCAISNKKGFSSYSDPLAAQKLKQKPLLQRLKSPLSNEQAIVQELTGKAVSRIPTQEQLKNRSLSTQHYYAGLRAAESKNYILAIKHFNTVLKNYPRSAEVQLAFASKAKIYNEMGLTDAAKLNMKMALRQSAVRKYQKTAQGSSNLKR